MCTVESTTAPVESSTHSTVGAGNATTTHTNSAEVTPVHLQETMQGSPWQWDELGEVVVYIFITCIHTHTHTLNHTSACPYNGNL